MDYNTLQNKIHTLTNTFKKGSKYNAEVQKFIHENPHTFHKSEFLRFILKCILKEEYFEVILQQYRCLLPGFIYILLNKFKFDSKLKSAEIAFEEEIYLWSCIGKIYNLFSSSRKELESFMTFYESTSPLISLEKIIITKDEDKDKNMDDYDNQKSFPHLIVRKVLETIVTFLSADTSFSFQNIWNFSFLFKLEGILVNLKNKQKDTIGFGKYTDYNIFLCQYIAQLLWGTVESQFQKNLDSLSYFTQSTQYLKRITQLQIHTLTKIAPPAEEPTEDIFISLQDFSRLSESKNYEFLLGKNEILMNINETTSPTSSLNHSPNIDGLIITPHLSSLLKNILNIFHYEESSILVRGLSGTGKTSLLKLLGSIVGQDSSHIITVNVDESVDSQALIGSYIVGESFGEFQFAKGPLTVAIEEGYWIVLENIENSTAEVVGILKSLVENRSLSFINAESMVKPKIGFRIFATSKIPQSQVNTDESIQLLSPEIFEEVEIPKRFDGKAQVLSQLAHDFHNISLPLPTLHDVMSIAKQKFSEMFTYSSKMEIYICRSLLLIKIMFFDRSFHIQIKNEDEKGLLDISETLYKELQGLQKESRSFLKGRHISLKDVIKFCQRINFQFNSLYGNNHKMEENEDNEMRDVYLVETLRIKCLEEIYDCFLCLLPSTQLKERALKELCFIWQLDHIEAIQYILRGSREDGFNLNQKQRLHVGRSPSFSLESSNINQLFDKNELRPFVHTAQALRTIEQLLTAIHHNEAILLVGPTGIGKTAIIGHMADIMGIKLHAFNLNEISDSSELLGGFKPINSKFLLTPFITKFSETFAKILNPKMNQPFLTFLAQQLENSNFGKLFKAIDHSIKSMKQKLIASENLKFLQEEVDQLHSEFIVMRKQITQIEANFAFKFIEGSLLRSLKEGEWILLDELNLGSEELLERLATIIDGLSITVKEKSDVRPIQRHPNFRLLCCMNPPSMIGKKVLPGFIRSKFTEIFVDQPEEESEIFYLMNNYAGKLIQPQYLHKICGCYMELRKQNDACLMQNAEGRKATFSLRNLCRALDYIKQAYSLYGIMRSIIDAFTICFFTQLSQNSKETALKIVEKFFPENVVPLQRLREKKGYIIMNNYYLRQGNEPVAEMDDSSFIKTSSFENVLMDLTKIIANTNLPILLEGHTSTGKTSMVEYLAKLTSTKCIRINNHQNTDVSEYIGTYNANTTGKLEFSEGLLISAIRNGYWVILDELNLAPSEVLEALNRLLDDNREIFIQETQEMVKAHPHFRVFATQNPVHYAGRKKLSEAFKNRFIQIFVDQIPSEDLKIILSKKAQLPPKFCKQMIQIMNNLQIIRSSENILSGRLSFITVLDLLKWASRPLDTIEALKNEGYFILAERLRNYEEKVKIAKILKINQINSEIYELYLNKPEIMQKMERVNNSLNNQENRKSTGLGRICWNNSMKRLIVLVHKCLMNKEPVLLIGETGTGKTTVCQILSIMESLPLICINCHQGTDASDFIGGLKTKKNQTTKFINSFIPTLTQLIARANNTELFPELRFLDEYLSAPKDKQIKQIKSAFQKFKKVVANTNATQLPLNDELRNKIEECKTLYQEKDKIFEWEDGPLVLGMKNGGTIFIGSYIELGIILLDEISLTEDSVLERLNSVLEKQRSLVLTEKGKQDVSVLYAHENFHIIATMNPGSDYGKKELSPALRNRFTEIWVDSFLTDDELVNFSKHLGTSFQSDSNSDLKITNILKLPKNDLYQIINEKVNSQLHQAEQATTNNSLVQLLFEFTCWYNFIFIQEYNLEKKFISIRDILTIIEFIGCHQVHVQDEVETELFKKLYVEGVSLVIIDGLGLNAQYSTDIRQKMKASCFAFLAYQLKKYNLGQLPHQDYSIQDSDATFKIGMFSLDKSVSNEFLLQSEFEQVSTNYSIDSKNVKIYLYKILRGMSIGKPILLEGSPGIGKTSLIQNIAHIANIHLVRVNLSQQTDMIDLLGCEYPVSYKNRQKSYSYSENPQFEWSDGVLLQAIRNGYWILLDELNLSSQTVLEGLNAILDHRKTIYIPLLNESFQCHPNFKIFATQNPARQGGKRNNLPKSFLNRFVKIYLEDLTNDDISIISSSLFPSIPVQLIETMKLFSQELSFQILHKFPQTQVEKCEFNLRDLKRFYSLLQPHFQNRNESLLYDSDFYQIEKAIDLIYLQRLQTKEQRKIAIEVYQSIFRKTFSYYNKNIAKFKISRKSIQIGDSKLSRNSYNPISSTKLKNYENWILPLERMKMDSLIQCINHKWCVLLSGKNGTGKSSLIRKLAALSGNRLTELSLSNNSDAMEIIGSFQQVNIPILFQSISHKFLSLLLSTISTLLAKPASNTSTELLAYSCNCEYLIHSHQHNINYSKSLNWIKTCLKKISLHFSTEIEMEDSPSTNALISQIHDIEAEIEDLEGILLTQSSFIGRFEWFDSVLVKGIERGDWILIHNPNFCNSSVLDRLNPLLEEQPYLLINEAGLINHKYRIVHPHPNFRIFFTMNNSQGELSRALRNRSVEIYIPDNNYITLQKSKFQEDLNYNNSSLQIFQNPSLLLEEFEIYAKFNQNQILNQYYLLLLLGISNPKILQIMLLMHQLTPFLKYLFPENLISTHLKNEGTKYKGSPVNFLIKWSELYINSLGTSEQELFLLLSTYKQIYESSAEDDSSSVNKLFNFIIDKISKEEKNDMNGFDNLANFVNENVSIHLGQHLNLNRSLILPLYCEYFYFVQFNRILADQIKLTMTNSQTIHIKPLQVLHSTFLVSPLLQLITNFSKKLQLRIKIPFELQSHSYINPSTLTLPKTLSTLSKNNTEIISFKYLYSEILSHCLRYTFLEKILSHIHKGVADNSSNKVVVSQEEEFEAKLFQYFNNLGIFLFDDFQKSLPNLQITTQSSEKMLQILKWILCIIGSCNSLEEGTSIVKDKLRAHSFLQYHYKILSKISASFFDLQVVRNNEILETLKNLFCSYYLSNQKFLQMSNAAPNSKLTRNLRSLQFKNKYNYDLFLHILKTIEPNRNILLGTQERDFIIPQSVPDELLNQIINVFHSSFHHHHFLETHQDQSLQQVTELIETIKSIPSMKNTLTGSIIVNISMDDNPTSEIDDNLLFSDGNSVFIIPIILKSEDIEYYLYKSYSEVIATWTDYKFVRSVGQLRYFTNEQKVSLFKTQLNHVLHKKSLFPSLLLSTLGMVCESDTTYECGPVHMTELEFLQIFYENYYGQLFDERMSLNSKSSSEISTTSCLDEIVFLKTEKRMFDKISLAALSYKTLLFFKITNLIKKVVFPDPDFSHNTYSSEYKSLSHLFMNEDLYNLKISDEKSTQHKIQDLINSISQIIQILKKSVFLDVSTISQLFNQILENYSAFEQGNQISSKCITILKFYYHKMKEGRFIQKELIHILKSLVYLLKGSLFIQISPVDQTIYNELKYPTLSQLKQTESEYIHQQISSFHATALQQFGIHKNFKGHHYIKFLQTLLQDSKSKLNRYNEKKCYREYEKAQGLIEQLYNFMSSLGNLESISFLIENTIKLLIDENISWAHISENKFELGGKRMSIIGFIQNIVNSYYLSFRDLLLWFLLGYCYISKSMDQIRKLAQTQKLVYLSQLTQKIPQHISFKMEELTPIRFIKSPKSFLDSFLQFPQSLTKINQTSNISMYKDLSMSYSHSILHYLRFLMKNRSTKTAHLFKLEEPKLKKLVSQMWRLQLNNCSNESDSTEDEFGYKLPQTYKLQEMLKEMKPIDEMTKDEASKKRELELQDEINSAFPNYYDEYNNLQVQAQTQTDQPSNHKEFAMDEFLQNILIFATELTPELQALTQSSTTKSDLFYNYFNSHKAFTQILEKALNDPIHLELESKSSLFGQTEIDLVKLEDKLISKSEMQLLPSNSYNFYKDPNPAQAKLVHTSIMELLGRIKNLLDEYPNNPILEQISILANKLMSFDLDCPLMKILAGLDLIVGKAQEWEEMASKRLNSLNQHLKPLYQIMIKFRKIQLLSWKNMLNIEIKQMEQEMYPKYVQLFKHFQLQYLNPIENENGKDKQATDKKHQFTEQEMLQFYSLIDSFMRDSTLGVFPQNLHFLNLLHIVTQNIHIDNDASSKKQKLSSELGFLVNYYLKYWDFYLQRLKELLEPIQTRIKEVIEISKWTVNNYIDYKEKMEKNHRQLARYHRDLKQILTQSFSVQVIYAEFEQFFNSTRIFSLSQQHQQLPLPSLKIFKKECTNALQIENPLIQQIINNENQQTITFYTNLHSTIINRIESIKKDPTKSTKQAAIQELIHTTTNIGIKKSCPVDPNMVDIVELYSIGKLDELKTSVVQNENLSKMITGYSRNIFESARMLNVILSLPSYHHDIDHQQFLNIKGTCYNLMMYTGKRNCKIVQLFQICQNLKLMVEVSKITETLKFILDPDLPKHNTHHFESKLFNHEDTNPLDSNSIIGSFMSLLNQHRVLLIQFEQFLQIQLQQKSFYRKPLHQSLETEITQIQVNIGRMIDRINKYRTTFFPVLDFITENMRESSFLEIVGELSYETFIEIENLYSQIEKTGVISHKSYLNEMKKILFLHFGLNEHIQSILTKDSPTIINNYPAEVNELENLMNELIELLKSLLSPVDNSKHDLTSENLRLDKLLNFNLSHISEEIKNLTNSNLEPLHGSKSLEEAYCLCRTLTLSEFLKLESLGRTILLILTISVGVLKNGFCGETSEDSKSKPNDKTQFEDGVGIGEGEGNQDVTSQIDFEEQVEGLQNENPQNENEEQKKANPEEEGKGFEMQNDFEGGESKEKEKNEEEEESVKDEDEVMDDVKNNEENELYDPNQELQKEKDSSEDEDPEKEKQNNPELDLQKRNIDVENEEEMVANQQNEEGAQSPKSSEQNEDQNKDKNKEIEEMKEEEKNQDLPLNENKLDLSDEEKEKENKNNNEEQEEVKSENNPEEFEEVNPNEMLNMSPPENKKEDQDQSQDFQMDEEDHNDSGDEKKEFEDDQEKTIQNEGNEELDDGHNEENNQPNEDDKNDQKNEEEIPTENIQMGVPEFENVQKEQKLETESKQYQNMENGQNEENENPLYSDICSQIYNQHMNQPSTSLQHSSNQTQKPDQNNNPSNIDFSQHIEEKLKEDIKINPNLDIIGKQEDIQNQLKEKAEVMQEASILQNLEKQEGLEATKGFSKDNKDVTLQEEIKKDNFEDVDMLKQDELSVIEEAKNESTLENKNQEGNQQNEEKKKIAHSEEKKRSDEDESQIKEDIGFKKEEKYLRQETEEIKINDFEKMEETETFNPYSNSIFDEKRLMELKIEIQSQFNNWLNSKESPESSLEYFLNFTKLTEKTVDSLIEQLRIIFQPNFNSRFKGDYKTGKRLNMKRIINFIASNYRNDKIWMRNTMPSKKDYKILLGIDDSLSMKQYNLGFFAMQSMITILRALDSLEVGNISVCSLRERLHLLMDFEEKYSIEKGRFLVSKFNFDYNEPNSSDYSMSNFLKDSNNLLEMNSSGNSPPLGIILSDGRFNKDNVRSHLIEAQEKGILYIFIILDNYSMEAKESILNMKATRIKPETDEIEFIPYLADFPFEYYLVLQDIEKLPTTLANILLNWFSLQN